MQENRLLIGEHTISHVCDLGAMSGKAPSHCVCVCVCVCVCETEGESVCCAWPVSEQCVVSAGGVMDVVFLCRGNWI